MRFKFIAFVVAGSLLQMAQAQNQAAPAGPSILDAQRGYTAPPKPAADEMLTVSDATKQTNGQPAAAGSQPGQPTQPGQPNSANGAYAPRAGAAQTEAKPIPVVDATGMPLDTAALRAASKTKVRQPKELELVRFSERDGKRKAVLSVNGVPRIVDVGAEVLDKVVTEIGKDTVCLEPKDKKSNPKADSKSKKCSKPLKFELQSQE